MRKNIKGLGLLLAIACISGVFYQGTGAYLTDERKVVNHLDFAGNLDKIYRLQILHKTVEYMRRHKT